MRLNTFTKFLLAIIIPTFGLLASCHNTKDDEIAQLPYIGFANDTKELTYAIDGGAQTIGIESSRTWKITGIPDWLNVTPTEGTGNMNITITASQNLGTEREATLTVTISQSTDYSTTLKIKQAGTQPIYFEDCGTTVEKESSGYWPYVDAFTGWSRTGSLDQSAVTYSGTNSSVRNSGSGYEPSGDKPTGAPYEYMANATAVFQINSINVTGKTNLTLTFYAQHQSVYSPQTFSAISSSTIKLQAGFDGTNWADLTFTSDGATGWSLVTSEFQVPTGTTTLYLKYSNFVGGGDNQLRIDDIKIEEGGSGALITPGGGVTPPPSGSTTNIGSVAEGSSYTMEGTVTGLDTRGFIFTDATGSILFYNAGYTDGTYVIGDKLTISGSISSYNKGLQIDGASATVTKTGTSTYTYPTPANYTATEIDAFIANTANRLATYVTYTGTLTISGTYYNVTVSGTTNQGSFYFPISSISSTLTTGTNVTVKGYAITVSSSKYVNTVVTEVTAAGGSSDNVSATPTTLSWAATATDAKTVTVTSSGAWTAAIDNSTDFTLSATSGVNGGTFTVTPTAANTTATAKTATVTLTCGAATTTIAASQAAAGSTSVNISTITATGSYQVAGTVSALCTRGFIVSDATGSVFYYGGTTYVDGSYAIGDQVTISGTVGTYNKGYQFDNTATVTKTGTGTYTYPTPASYTSTEVDAFVANTANRLATYVTYTGTLTISGTYYNVTVSGTTNQGSFYFPISSISSALTTGTNVTVKGYAITVSSSKYVNTIVTEVTAAGGASDNVSATPTTLNWAATATDAKTVTVTSSAAWTAAIDNTTDFTLSTTSGVNGGTFTVTPNAANTTAAAKTATVTLTCGTATTTIAVSQAAAAAASDAVSASPTTLSWVATASDAKTVTVTSSAAWTAAIDNTTDFTLSTTSGVNGGTFTVTPNAANTTTTAKTATVTLTCGTATATVSCSQAAASAGGTMTGIPATWDFNTATLASGLINATSGNTNATISAVGVSGFTIAGTSIKYPTATAWTTSSYWLITIPVTNFAANTTVNLAYEQRSSNTGPKNFVSEYSTDGGTTWTESGTVAPMDGTNYITENVNVVVANAIASGNLLIRIRVSNTDSAKGDGSAIASGGANRLSGGSFAVTIN